MAINIEWQLMPPGKNNKEDKPQMFPRIAENEVIDEQQLAQWIADHGALSRGQALTAINDLAEVMTRLIREGKTINFPSLGAFRLSIGTDSPIYADNDRRMQRIIIKGVHFQPDRQLIKAIGTPSFVWKPGTGMPIAPTCAQIIPILTAYFKTHNSITRTEFERMFHLKRTTAYCRLKELVKMEIIQTVGNGRDTKYVKMTV